MSDTLNLPVIDFNILREEDPEGFAAECKRAADAFRDYGAVAVRDPRVVFEDNETFLTMMERYFEMSDGERGANAINNMESFLFYSTVHSFILSCRCETRVTLSGWSDSEWN